MWRRKIFGENAEKIQDNDLVKERMKNTILKPIIPNLKHNDNSSVNDNNNNDSIFNNTSKYELFLFILYLNTIYNFKFKFHS